MKNPALTPVIVGVGQFNDRDCVHDSLGLMIEALSRADTDAGGGWIGQLDSLAVVAQISFAQLGNCAQLIADHFGIASAHVEPTPHPTG